MLKDLKMCFELIMNLLDVLCHGVESGLIRHGRGIIPTEKVEHTAGP